MINSLYYRAREHTRFIKQIIMKRRKDFHVVGKININCSLKANLPNGNLLKYQNIREVST